MGHIQVGGVRPAGVGKRRIRIDHGVNVITAYPDGPPLVPHNEVEDPRRHPSVDQDGEEAHQGGKQREDPRNVKDEAVGIPA